MEQGYRNLALIQRYDASGAWHSASHEVLRRC
jgi:hypothetical protein